MSPYQLPIPPKSFYSGNYLRQSYIGFKLKGSPLFSDPRRGECRNYYYFQLSDMCARVFVRVSHGLATGRRHISMQ